MNNASWRGALLLSDRGALFQEDGVFEHFILGAQGPGAELAWGFVDSTEFHLKGFRVPPSSSDGFRGSASREEYGTPT